MYHLKAWMDDYGDLIKGHKPSEALCKMVEDILEDGIVTEEEQTMYAFLEGISNTLEIERNDIDGILELNLEETSYDVLLYDNVPGGAGHVKRLLNREAIINSLEAALSKVSQHCCDENTSCYNCLRNYYNQAYHSRLRRIYAKEVIGILLKEVKEC